MLKKIALILGLLVVLVVGAGVAWYLVENSRRQDNMDRAARLMDLAAKQAGNIKVHRIRLQRQLNIAHMQNQNKWFKDARFNLAQARKTIESAGEKDLGELDRIAGWISISELSRPAKDMQGAKSACQQAVKILGGMEPAKKRCEYVRGIAAELWVLDAKAQARELLRQAGPWASEIEDPAYRRNALVAIAVDLFNYDDYEGGNSVFEQDPDASWRSNTLVELSQAAMPQQLMCKMAYPSDAKTFGKDVRFEANYRMEK